MRRKAPKRLDNRLDNAFGNPQSSEGGDSLPLKMGKGFFPPDHLMRRAIREMRRREKRDAIIRRAFTATKT